MLSMESPRRVTFKTYNLLAVILSWCLSLVDAEGSVLGCGGFVKSDVPIDFSRVVIRLYSRTGSLKFETDCAPNNGYYFVPIYDKGDYTLKVEPPNGWSFDPPAVDVTINGNDPCSKGVDVNFKFLGFSISGVVTSLGYEDVGPKGVKLTLKTEGMAKTQTTETDKQGKFSFTGIQPGSHHVSASHAKWRFMEPAEVDVKVESDDIVIKKALMVRGYDISGQVLSEDQPVGGVQFLLFCKGTCPSQPIEGCTKQQQGILKPDIPEAKFACYVESNQKHGVFTFPVIPPGEYIIIPQYKKDKLNFEVLPKQLLVSVTHGSLEIQDAFLVAGFSVSGRILTTSGKGMEGAKVQLSGTLSAITDSNGVFTLEGVKSGMYKITVQMTGYKFQEHTHQVTALSPVLPTITPMQVEVCGFFEKPKDGVLPAGLLFTSFHVQAKDPADQSKAHQASVDENGKFCTYLAPGKKFSLYPLTPTEARSHGLTYSPNPMMVLVSDIPMRNLKFTPFRAKITGEVECINKCSSDIQIALIPEEGTPGSESKVTLQDRKFVFENVLPGYYNLQIVKEGWCWEHSSLKISIDEATPPKIPQFKQSGYILKISSSHDAKLKYENGKKKGDLNVIKGKNEFCLQWPGSYILQPQGCHHFGANQNFTWSTDKNDEILFTASSHLLSGSVVSNFPIEALLMLVQIPQQEKPIELGPLKGSEGSAGTFKYHFEYLGKVGEELIIMPQAKNLLFDPQEFHIKMQDECLKDVVQFRAEKGLVISGQVEPPLPDVLITVHCQGKEPIKIKTDAAGKYLVGPLQKDHLENVTAEKQGYSFTPGKTLGHFIAYKLAEIIVKCKDGENVLPDVLVTVAGGEAFRQNSLTDADGVLYLIGLSPGNYFVKPVLKEYEFLPGSHYVELKAGQTLNVDFSGTRTAYSVHGQVVTLLRDPISNVMVEAVGQSRSECQRSHEEAASQGQGQFHIKGLLPGCSYIIRIRGDQALSHQMETWTPHSIPIEVKQEDILGMRFIGLRPQAHLDLTAYVDTDKEYLSSLKFVILRDDHQLLTLPLTPPGSRFFTFPSLNRDPRKVYTIRLESDLPRSTYYYSTSEMHVRANETYQHLQFSFHPKRKPEEKELPQGSLLVILLLVVTVVVALNWNKFSIASLSNARVRPINPRPASAAADAVIIEPVQKRKARSRRQ